MIPLTLITTTFKVLKNEIVKKRKKIKEYTDGVCMSWET